MYSTHLSNRVELSIIKTLAIKDENLRSTSNFSTIWFIRGLTFILAIVINKEITKTKDYFSTWQIMSL